MCFKILVSIDWLELIETQSQLQIFSEKKLELTLNFPRHIA